MSSHVKHRIAAITLIMLASALLGAAGTRPVSGGDARAAGTPLQRYIVVLKNSIENPGVVASRHSQRYGLTVTKVYRSALKGYAAMVPRSRLASLRTNPNVRFLFHDRRVKASDQKLGTGVNRINAENKTNKGTGVNVAVIDTGIDLGHPDLAANIVGGKNCSRGGRRNYNDGNGHGTHVAGIIAALDNGVGVVGVAPEAKLWAVRVLDDTGAGYFSDIVCGIDFVDSKSPAKGGLITVANMSLAGFGADDGNCGNTNGDALHMAICRTVSDGVTFVVAAGNNIWDLSQKLTFVPAAYDEVITVSALADLEGSACGLGSVTSWGADDDFANFSNYATSAADLSHLVAAPGVDIYSTWKGGAYQNDSGTSMASPHVAGAAALYIATHPGASPASVHDALRATGEPELTNFNGECAGGAGNKNQASQRFSHVDSSVRHPEVMVRADSL